MSNTCKNNMRSVLAGIDLIVFNIEPQDIYLPQDFYST